MKTFAASDLVLSDAALTPSSNQPLTSTQVDHDLALLNFALMTAYSGRNHLPAPVFAELRESLSKIHGSLTPIAFRDQIDAVLLTVPDRHLQAQFKGKVSVARTKGLKIGQVGANAIHDSHKVWEVRREKWKDQRYLYVSITRFAGEKDPAWGHFLRDVKDGLPGTQFLVLDLRGNGGGDDSVGYALAQLLFGHEFDDPQYRHYFGEGAEAQAIQGNVYRALRKRLRDAGEPVPDHLTQRIADYDQRQAHARNALPGASQVLERTEFHPWKSHAFDPEHGYDQDTFILMDGVCASSCESTITAFETNPHVRRVGENTAGYVHFGNIGVVRLPASGVVVQMGTNYSEFYDGRMIEREGIKPDLFVPPGKEALDYLLHELPLAL